MPPIRKAKLKIEVLDNGDVLLQVEGNKFPPSLHKTGMTKEQVLKRLEELEKEGWNER